jgi:hypothetical protein
LEGLLYEGECLYGSLLFVFSSAGTSFEEVGSSYLILIKNYAMEAYEREWMCYGHYTDCAVSGDDIMDLNVVWLRLAVA